MNISEIMNLIDKEKLEELGTLYKVDKINNKITGKFIVKNFVKCILMKRAVSLRSLEMLCNNSKELFELLKSKRLDKKQVDHSSIGKRLKSINVEYFQGIYEDLVSKYNNKFVGNDKQKLKDAINAKEIFPRLFKIY